MPTKEQAEQFALMLNAGLPAEEAILYFTDSEDPAEVGEMLANWLRSKALKAATLKLQSKPWTEMSLEEKLHTSIDLHYAGLAYFLFTHNYGSLGPADKAKADTARGAIEAKLAGTAGKTDVLSQFISDLNSGKRKLTPTAEAAPKLAIN
jgi:hypothetical protein